MTTHDPHPQPPAPWRRTLASLLLVGVTALGLAPDATAGPRAKMDRHLRERAGRAADATPFKVIVTLKKGAKRNFVRALRASGYQVDADFTLTEAFAAQLPAGLLRALENDPDVVRPLDRCARDVDGHGGHGLHRHDDEQLGCRLAAPGHHRRQRQRGGGHDSLRHRHRRKDHHGHERVAGHHRAGRDGRDVTARLRRHAVDPAGRLQRHRRLWPRADFNLRWQHHPRADHHAVQGRRHPDPVRRRRHHDRRQLDRHRRHRDHRHRQHRRRPRRRRGPDDDWRDRAVRPQRDHQQRRRRDHDRGVRRHQPCDPWQLHRPGPGRVDRRRERGRRPGHHLRQREHDRRHDRGGAQRDLQELRGHRDQHVEQHRAGQLHRHGRGRDAQPGEPFGRRRRDSGELDRERRRRHGGWRGQRDRVQRAARRQRRQRQRPCRARQLDHSAIPGWASTWAPAA